MIAEKTLTGLGLFALEIIHLVSAGKTESIKEIEEHFATNDIVEYLSKKYDEDFWIKFDNSTYDNNEINKYFNKYVGYIEGNEGRKYGIMNDSDGLLLVLALSADIIEPACRNLSADK